MRLNYPPGARMFVDYSGDRVPVVDAGTGEVAQAEVFVAVLGCSVLGICIIIAAAIH